MCWIEFRLHAGKESILKFEIYGLKFKYLLKIAVLDYNITMDIHLYNTMSRWKELFVPINKDQVRIYSCWPTVYSEPHIGNFRSFFMADILRATLKYIWGYSVFHVMNITDVGHLTDDGDQGEDKMEKGAKKEGLTVRDIARKYEYNFLAYLKALDIDDFDVYPRATDHIKEQIDMVKTLTEKKYTYVIENDGIYMDTSKVDDYGKLAHLDIEWLSSEHRWDGAKIDSSTKKQLTDFALWKFSPKDEQRSMEWIYDGPRSGLLLDDAVRQSLTDEEQLTRWFPWWHIECSAMATKYLGEHFDIHTWGIDHVSVHHTNEIAQAECCLGTDHWVNYWMHGQFLQIDGGKVSKSKGHDLSVPWVIAAWYDPLDLRYFYLTGHWRSFLDFTWESLDAAKKSRANMIKKISQKVDIDMFDFTDYQWWEVYKKLSELIANDLDTVWVLALMHTVLWQEEVNYNELTDILYFDTQITKIWLYRGVEYLQEQKQIAVPDDIKKLANERLAAKMDKDYDRADALREQLREAGWIVHDTANGYELEYM